jgi:putative ABC transport system permease protein
MNVETAAQFLSDDDYNDGKYDVDDVNFYMNDSSKAEEFVEKINSDFTELAENNLKVSVDTTEYDAMASSIEGVGSFATTILIIVIAAAIVIVALIVTLNVRERRYEMGVLMSLGVTKKNILGQIAAELIIVGTVGFALASITGGFLAKTMGQSILDSQIASSVAQSEKNFGRPGAQIGGKSGGQMSGGSQMPSTPEGTEMPEEESSEKKSKKPTTQQTNVELDISATPIDYLLLFVTGYVVIVLALIVPATNVLRYQPKEILAGKE